MQIYTKAGMLAFRVFNFPDGQPHFILETYEREFSEVTIETAIKSPSDLFIIQLVSEVLRKNGYSIVNLDIRFLLGARMDRAIDWAQPCTLDLVARLINSCGFSRVRILDVHSPAALSKIRNSENVLPHAIVGQVRTSGGGSLIACPDKGAQDRVKQLAPAAPILFCEKARDPQTGVLSGFRVPDFPGGREGSHVLILDDICDGGGTFIGLAAELRKAGAKRVNLFVTHGIFSKGLPLKGIDTVYTTDTYYQAPTGGAYNPRYESYGYVVTIPISMKDL